VEHLFRVIGNLAANQEQTDALHKRVWGRSMAISPKPTTRYLPGPRTLRILAG
jgi:hypothetical protein